MLHYELIALVVPANDGAFELVGVRGTEQVRQGRAGGRHDLDLRAEGRPHGREGSDDVWREDHGAAATLRPREDSAGPEEGYPAKTLDLEREDAVVAQQHGRCCCEL